ncbi:acid phosphatase/Vanadium-dependent haloperoxidase [Rhizodiscina lignyota]|uniref:Acid phosphatase/Vanadium-dependent haloperoxidase n=1 Tax=Rhizodiscina lignyota TaxID=1504668 RepID=A0A9P4IGK1_9PEZI|nr:acid phosphatase/Vanadium-dependent haloperoxidase [Rhizodiscina lignyota]
MSATATRSVVPSGFLASLSRFWARSYIPDYLGLAAVLAAHTIQGFFFREPFHPQFTLDNPAIQHPHALHERVPVLWLFICAGGIPLGALILWAVLFRPGWHKVHVTILGFFISVMVTSLITDIIKNAIGRPRPDLIDRCKPQLGTPGHTLLDFDVCTETNHHTLNDGFRSFPSGHSSFSFAGLGYLSFFLTSQLRALHPRVDLFRIFVAFTPLVGAALIALSRYEDYRHDPYDITAGSLLGFLLAFGSWRRYYPSLRSQHCNTPYPTRDAEFRKEEEWHHKRRDEEEMVGSSREFEIGDDQASEELPLTHIRSREE